MSEKCFVVLLFERVKDGDAFLNELWDKLLDRGHFCTLCASLIKIFIIWAIWGLKCV